MRRRATASGLRSLLKSDADRVSIFRIAPCSPRRSGAVHETNILLGNHPRHRPVGAMPAFSRGGCLCRRDLRLLYPSGDAAELLRDREGDRDGDDAHVSARAPCRNRTVAQAAVPETPMAAGLRRNPRSCEGIAAEVLT